MPSIPPPVTVAPAGLAAGTPRRRNGWGRAWRWSLAGLLLVASIVVAAWLLLVAAILPRIEHWRPALEKRATQALGVPVRIGAIEVTNGAAAWHWARGLTLHDVVLLESPRPGEPAGATAREALRLPTVQVALSPASLLPGWDGRWRLRFEQLLIDGARLELRRDAAGRIWVAGLETSAGPGDGSAADWFFSQHEFAIRNGTLVWTDELRGAPPLALSAVDLVVRNGVRRHELRLDATPPAAWGERISLRGRFVQPLLGAPGERASGLLARPGEWRRWRGTLYAELPDIDIEPLRQAIDLPYDLSRGAGALRAWVEVRDAEPVAATADLALRDVVLKLAADTEPLAFSHIEGRLGGRFDARDGGELQARGLSFATADGLSWPAGDADLRWRIGADGAAAGGEFKAERLDLALLAQVTERLPAAWIGAPFRTRVADLAPGGIASQVEARWDGPPAQPRRYRVQASLRSLSLAPQSAAASAPEAAASAPPVGRPGVQGVDIDFNATEAGGEARVAIKDGALDFPGVFELPRIALDSLSGNLAWRIDAGGDGAPPRVELRARDLRFANADTAGQFDATWSTAAPRADGSGRLPGTLDLNGRLDRAEASRVARYLPLGVSADARHYVERAVQAGHASAVSFKLKGDLRDFPFGGKAGGKASGKPGIQAPPAGEFRVAAQLEGVRFAFAPGDADWNGEPDARGRPWPAFTDVKGELVFDRHSMALNKMQGRLGSVGSGSFELTRVQGGIRDLGHDAALTIEGAGRGPLADALRFVEATPIGGWIGGGLAQASTGPNQAPIDLQLALTIPLNHSRDTTLRGSLVLPGNDLRLRPEAPMLAGAKARIAFTERNFTLAAGSARALGGEAAFDGGSQADGSLRFNVQGTASAEGLRRAGELGALSRAAAQFSGQTAYRLALGVVRGQAEWQLSSNLVGLGLDLPAPLRKAAEQPLPLRVQASLLADGVDGAGRTAGPARDQLRVELGADGARLLQAAWTRELAADGARVLRGGIGVQDSMPQPAEGVAANVNLARLDVDAWQRIAEGWGGAGGDSGYAPGTLALRVQELIGGGRRLNRVVVGLSRGGAGDEGLWRANLDAAELNGYAEYRPPGTRSGEAAGRLYARLARLSLPKSEADAVSNLLEQASPASVPALDIVVEDLDLNGKRLGRVEIEAQNRAADPGAESAREWRLGKFRLVTPEAQFNATGQWAPATAGGGARRRAVMDFGLDIADSGALLTRLGYAGVVRGGKGRLSGQIGWLGSPLSIDLPSLGGQVNVALEGGQFLQAEPGIAKLLGVLSLQALPRRLLLDFRDVFEQGFVFDGLAGDVAIADGVATTRLLSMRGVQAVVLMQGSADIARETQDLRVWVVPEINAGTASLAVAAINPAVGIGSFLAQLFLRRPLIEAGTREFRVTGPWAQPKVDRVERRLGDAMPNADAASAAPAAPAKENR